MYIDLNPRKLYGLFVVFVGLYWAFAVIMFVLPDWQGFAALFLSGCGVAIAWR